MNVKQAIQLLNTIKLHQGQRIKLTYYKKNYSYQLVNDDWKIIYDGFEKVSKDVILCEVNNFNNILVDDNGTKISFPFFGVDCIIESLGIINEDDSVSLFYKNQLLQNFNLNTNDDELGQQTKKEMFQCEDIDEQIKEYMEKDKLSKSPNNPILNNLFDKQSIFDYGTKDRVFPFTNEMLNLYMPAYSFKDKKILANLGSGDFALNAYLLGASLVNTFDINEYSYYYYELKKAMIKYYSYDEFLNTIENPKKVYDDFNSYKHFLNDDVSEIITEMFKKYSSCLVGFAKKLFLPAAFNSEEREFSSKDLKSLNLVSQFRNFYLRNEQNYNLLRSQLLNGIDNKSIFLLGDVTRLQFRERYDMIYLSNIGDVINAQQYYDFILFLRDNILTDDGQIIVVDKFQKFSFLLDDENVTQNDYDVTQIAQYNERNAGLSSIPDSEKNVCLYSIYKQPKLKYGYGNIIK